MTQDRPISFPIETLSSVREEAADWPRGGSEMAARIADFDWAATPLGPIALWPQSLKNAVDLMIGSPQFTTLAWGPALTLLYNDACAALLGTRHPAALGRSYTDVWRVQGPGDVIGETLSGRSTHYADQFFRTPSRLHQPVGWFTGSRTPLRDETGAIVAASNILLKVERSSLRVAFSAPARSRLARRSAQSMGMQRVSA